ncbi:hypothetical protein [Desulfobacter sp.]|uniref:hypothetical protein n=1 Tax=Desulfobacter sp. TaxID=2294 RepID=UPI00257CAC11|nr:hypothetical protein [Desulfobacter sp.]
MDFVDQIQKNIEHMTNGVETAHVKVLADRLNSLETDCVGKQEALFVIKMMHSLIKYLDARKDKAHPETLPALGTLADNLKSLLISSSVEEQAQLLSRSKDTFKFVKSAIESGKLILDSEMEELKAVILSVDWEISNITMEGFDRVLIRLEKRLKSDKMHHTFLRIMHEIGAHIAQHQANAHQDSVSLLRRVFHQYELLLGHPSMPSDKKKELVQESIQAYKAFKRKIDAGLTPGPSAEDHTPSAVRTIQHPGQVQPAAPGNIAEHREDDGFAPALSHINEQASDQEESPFFTLDDPMTDPASALGARKGTQSTEKDSLPPQRDVMGDLFSMKESAADELLDAIHLSSIHGPDQENAASIPGVMGAAEKKAGVQQVTPQRMGNTPIPEIESRLDAFFNLSSSDDRVMEVQDPPDSQSLDHAENLGGESNLSAEPVDFSDGNDPGIDSAGIDLLEEPADSSGQIGPVPDREEDEIHLEEQPGDDDAVQESFLEDDTDGNMTDQEPDPNLDDLQKLLFDPDTLSRLDVFEQVQEKIASLNDIWAPDSDKVRLLDLVSSMARFIHRQAVPDTEENGMKDSEFDDGLNGMATAEPDQTQEKDREQKKKGIFAGLKALFKG